MESSRPDRVHANRIPARCRRRTPYRWRVRSTPMDSHSRILRPNAQDRTATVLLENPSEFPLFSIRKTFSKVSRQVDPSKTELDRSSKNHLGFTLRDTSSFYFLRREESAPRT